MAPWNWKNPCTSAATESDEASQTPSPIRKHVHNGFAATLYQRENGTWRSNNSPNATGINSTYQNPNSNSTTNHSTPVLFSTNRGLHLRVAKPKSKPWAATEACTACCDAGESKCNALEITGCNSASDNGSSTRSHNACIFEIHFCDLERWSTNRANTICLEDTFIVSRRNNSLPNSNVCTLGRESINFNCKNQRSTSIFCVPSGSRHALAMPRRSLYQRSTSIQSTFERFGLH